MKTIIIIAIIIVGTLSAVFIFSTIPSDIWTDQRTDFTGVSPPGELDEKIDCLSKGGVWDYTSCNFEEPAPEPTSENEMNLRGAMQKLQEIYILNSSFGPFNIRDVIVGYGIAGDVLVVDVLTEYYESDHWDLIKQKILDIVGNKVTIEFSPSGAIIPTNIESESELKLEPSDTKPETPPLQIKVVGENQVRRGTTHSIEIQVIRGSSPIEGARVFIDIEDYDENIIKEFKGYTDSRGYFVFSWEIPQYFDDIETLLAFIDVTDGISSKTELFKFQVYCLPGEQNCKVEGN